MRRKNPFEPARSGRVVTSHLQDGSTWHEHYYHPDEPAACSEGIMNGHREMQLSPITWNPRLRIYESHEPIYQPNPALATITQSIVVFTAIWSICELPLELLVSPTVIESAASIIGKLIWMSLTLWALTGGQPAKTIFALCCGASALTIASGLLDERQFFAWGYCMSTVECGLKAAAFFLIVWTAAR